MLVIDEPPGRLILDGGTDWSRTASEAAGLVGSGAEVVVLPTGSAYERPELSIAAARVHFAELGATVKACMVLSRSDAENAELAAIVRAARCCYLTGGSPLHLRSVLKDSLVFDALVAAWRDGAAIAGWGAGATTISDPMVDPRGGAFTVGLGLVRGLAVVPGFDGELTAGLRRTIALAPADCAVVAIGSGTAIVREPDGTWSNVGNGACTVFLDGEPVGLEVLAGKALW